MGIFNWFKKYDDRPRIKIEPTAVDRIIDALSLVFLLLLLVMVFQYYPDLPDKIPTHFNSLGQADDFGRKNSILLLPVMAVILFVLIQILGKYPHQFNYLVKITPQNAKKQYRLGARIMRFTNLFVMMVFYYTDYKVIKMSINQETPNLDKWFVPVVLGVTTVGIIVIFTVSILINKKSK